MRLTLIIVGILLFTVFSGCSQVDAPTLTSKSQFEEFASLPLYQKYGQVSSVKIVYEVAEKKLHFVPSKDFEFHYEYCVNEIGFYGSLGNFNDVCYSGSKSRPFLLANINYYKASDTYALELGPSDRMNAEQLATLIESFQGEAFFGDRLKLMVNTVHVKSILDQLTAEIELLYPEEVYNRQTYQPIAKFKRYGHVRVIENWENESDSIRATDILILKDIPLSFPMVNGVVVTDFQTPLSHVSILGQNRKIPICAYTKLFETDQFTKLDGEVVEFMVTQDTFILRPFSGEIPDVKRSKNRLKLKLNTEVDSLIPIYYLKEKESDVVGNKAANFGELAHYAEKMDFKVPESAFAIPFHFYQNHVVSSRAQGKINALLRKDLSNKSRAEIESELIEIQTLILNAQVDSKLISDVENMIVRLGDYRRMRFRSSTNAEDRDGFSGAGLYASKTGELGNPKKPIDEAIKKVWASLWNYEAFMEREAFNIDHSTVAMGILVHRSFPNEEVNGVAITTNLYRDDYLGFVVNAQLGDESVVAPKNGVQCDQFICYPDESTTDYGKKEGGIDVITVSSLNNGEMVMTEKEIQHLANQLERIKSYYLRRHFTSKTYFNFGLDLEFKLDHETRELYIKQMRIFNN